MNREELYRELDKLKIEMTPGERMKTYLNGGEVDCLPYGWVSPRSALADMWGMSRYEIAQSFDKSAELIRLMRDNYGISGISSPLSMYGLAVALGAKDEWKYGFVRSISEYPLKSYNQIDEYGEFDPAAHEHTRAKLEYALKMKQVYPEMSFSTDVGGPMSTAIAFKPIGEILRDMVKNPEGVHSLLKFCVEGSLKWVEYFYNNTGCTSVTIADPATTSDLLGGRFFNEFSKPYFKTLFDGIYDITGRKPKVHVCGHTSDIWEDLAEIGVEMLSFDNRDSMADAAALIGDRVTIMGNVDPVSVLLLGSIDEVLESVRNVIAEASGSARGMAVFSGCSLAVGTPKENLDAFVYAVHKYGAHARLGEACEVKI